ncbi:MAG: hypothetical protein HY892_01500 [Deltaproteobacteria bacterium]|nr:hypothetical protein [Deltaproteobacteria bacterium]
MKTKKIFQAGGLVLLVTMLLTFSAGQTPAAAATGGDVLNQLAVLLEKNSSELTALLFPAGGWDPNAPAGEAVLAQLYLALNTAIQNGALQGNAENLIIAAAGKAGVSAETAKGGITYGTSISAAAGARGPVGTAPGGFGPGTAGAGGGGGVGVSTQSR